MIVHFRGRLVDAEEAGVSALSAASTRGSNAIETVRGYRGDHGEVNLFRLDDYLATTEAGADGYRQVLRLNDRCRLAESPSSNVFDHLPQPGLGTAVSSHRSPGRSCP